MDPGDAERWIRSHVVPVGPIEVAHERPWATVLRVPLADGAAWFKACAAVQSFEPRLTAELSRRWPDLVGVVLGHDERRGWLLLRDAGSPMSEIGNRPELWEAVLPRYAELQRGETSHVEDHLAQQVPDLRVSRLPEQFEDLLRHDLPLEPDEIARLRAFAPGLEKLCTELAARGVPETVQHDDLHIWNVYVDGDRLRLLDWGDASIAHPFESLVVTFRFLEELNGLAPDDPWLERLREAYLEPWGAGHEETFELAMRVGAFARAIPTVRQRDHLSAPDYGCLDDEFSTVLRRALLMTQL